MENAVLLLLSRYGTSKQGRRTAGSLREKLCRFISVVRLLLSFCSELQSTQKFRRYL